MNSQKRLTGVFLGALLASGVMVTPTAFAEDSGSCSTCDLLSSVNDLKAVVTDKEDIKRSELAQAIINYLAQIEQNRYNLMITWHVDPAPGTNDAMLAGKNLGNAAYGPMVIDKVADRLVDSLGVISIGGVPQKNAESLIYDQLRGYYQTAITDPGNTSQMKSQLSMLNFASLYQNPSVPINDANMNLLIKLITDPYSTPLPLPNENDAAGKAALANAAVEKAIASVGLNTFMDILAKRNPNASNEGKLSMLQLMENESSWRIKDVSWFRNISTSSQEALLREIAQMMAFNLWMNYQQYRQNEQIAAMTAALLASQTRLTNSMITMSKMLGDVNSQVKAAQADANVQKIKIETPEQ